jgi:glycine/D-amino acid oxidase-like deaminating enzyme
MPLMRPVPFWVGRFYKGIEAMPTRNFDVVILGGGNAGMGVTVATREAGLSVAMIEPDLLGGTCPNRGCMPKKVLVAAGHALDEIERAKAHHITVGKPTLDWPALIEREKTMIRGIPDSLANLMNRRGVEVIRDRGRLVGPNAVTVNGETLEAKHLVIATGSKPRRLPFPGAELMILRRRPERECAAGNCRVCRRRRRRTRVQLRLRAGRRSGHDPRAAAAAAPEYGCRCSRPIAR